MSKDLREHDRVQVQWRAAFKGGDGSQIHRGKILDISLGGVAAHFDSSIPVGFSGILFVEIPLSVSGKKKYLEIESVVVYCTLVGHINAFRTGVKFKSLDAEARTMLMKFCSR